MKQPASEHLILIVDDEPEILRAVRAGLRAQGYETETASSGEEALRLASGRAPHLVILDLMLPGISGIDVCERLREWTNVPIIVLSALGQERQKVKALDAGADDYLTKPFGMDELTARVRAALRRQTGALPEQQPSSFTADDVEIDFAARIVRKAKQEIKLTPIEYEILRFLTQNADRVVTHRQLLSTVWGAEYSEETQLLRVHIGHLRQKIETNPSHPRLVITEPGVGYRFRTPD
ncbi:MAG: response regulator transcription factor [Capsulimonadaceae bacterium]|nr:response regulator transcription factor [Capsulimonadaceae bacterium]